MSIRGKRTQFSTKFEHQANNIFYEISDKLGLDLVEELSQGF